jgi:cytidine deaminase
MTNEELINHAAAVVHAKWIKDYLVGDVGCALITDKGNIYLGVCADVASNSYCAEHMAIGAMMMAGEYRIEKIVAVWKNEEGELFVLSPCGNCREFMRQVNEENLEADVILEKDKTVKLKELLPYPHWFHKLA